MAQVVVASNNKSMPKLSGAVKDRIYRHLDRVGTDDTSIDLGIATGFAPTDCHGDARTRQSLAVVRFTAGGHYLAAINIAPRGSENSTWYTTVTESIADRLPLSSYTSWPEIAQHEQHIQVVSEWTSIG
ncbi:hypothetical protein [Nocardia salmonicida]|uniref:hypothetical protein n=1 Tax=Nocardia salmonicida TaxID=53431 RepID=UPI003CF07484